MTAKERQARALQLRLDGLSYRAIAAQLGYANPGGVHRAVSKALADIPREAADQLRTVELERLDEAVWQNLKALREGDVSVTMNLVRLSDQRARLVGLYATDSSAEHQDIKQALGGFLQDAITADQARQAELHAAAGEAGPTDVED